jgi:hypothetical protein
MYLTILTVPAFILLMGDLFAAWIQVTIVGLATALNVFMLYQAAQSYSSLKR